MPRSKRTKRRNEKFEDTKKQVERGLKGRKAIKEGNAEEIRLTRRKVVYRKIACSLNCVYFLYWTTRAEFSKAAEQHEKIQRTNDDIEAIMSNATQE